ncbi:hypothetical protein BGZ97_012143 [Linnemannia gamsii]|uniref:K Homology domain-containing protein n=1 Tax=Linnemannia gamsii TaxID=64522 RepID=A0A9P6R6A5_9FUNG|nr:hypothetical protein BGZ97_012143 [Linnemannia gamsii]
MPSDAPQDGAPAPKVDFTSALAKVKAIAAKLGSSASTAAPSIPAAASPSTSAPPMMKRPYEDDSYGSHGGQSGGYGGHDSRGDDNHYGKRMAYDSGRDSGPMHRPGLGSQVSHYAPPMRNEHTVQEEMGVPGNLVGLIIGRGGENLKRIERETGCKVQFSQDGNSNDRERFVNIVGQPAGIADARRQIQEIITSSQTGERPGGFGGYGGGGSYGMGGGDGYGRGGSSSTIQIPSAKVGLVIGRRGETIRDLQDRSGARIAVTPTPQDHNSPSRTVTITGDDSAIERAKTFIEEIVNDMAPRGAYGGGGFQNTPPVTMTVPQESIGLVIGRGGETVKQLQIQSRAKIQVQQVDPSVPAPAERTINLSNMPSNSSWRRLTERGYGGSSGGYGGGYGGYNQQQSYQQPAQSSAGGYGQQYGSGYGAAAAAPAAATPAASTYTPEQQAAYAQYYGYQYGSAAGYPAAAATATSAAPGADATAASSAAATPAVGADTSSYGTYDYSRYGQYGTTAAASSAAPATSSAVAAVTPTAGTTPAAVAAPTSDATATSSAAVPAAASAAGGAAATDYSAYYAQQEAYQQYYSQYYGYQAPAADSSAPTAAAANGGSDAASSAAPASGASDTADAPSSDAAAADSSKDQ